MTAVVSARLNAKRIARGGGGRNGDGRPAVRGQRVGGGDGTLIADRRRGTRARARRTGGDPLSGRESEVKKKKK